MVAMRPFRPSWWLPGPHLPTIWGKKFRRQPEMHDRLEGVGTPDGDHLTLARMGEMRAGIPHLLILHGLEGTVRATYAHGLLAQAKARGWSGDLLLFRTCDGEMNQARRMYHSGETSDVDFIVRRLRAHVPLAPIVICGVSLGGNVLLKWLGELGTSATELVSRAVAVSVPFDLEAGSRALETGFARLYVRHFLATLRPKALLKAIQYPGVIDVEGARNARTFFEFDDAVTAPLHGFAGASDYYRRSSSLSFLSRIRLPTLLLHALNDPFVPREVVARVRNEIAGHDFVELMTTTTGGHVGWVEGSPLSARYFMEQQVVHFLADSG
jgi:predicted alpha/beta-fold hydrolase